MKKRMAILLAIPAMLSGGPALAQDSEPAAAQPTVYSDVWESWSPTWSDADIQQAAEAFIGTWKTTAAVGESGGDADGSANMLMIVEPAPVSGVSDALYVEQYRSDMARPFRQAVMQFYRYKNGLRLRTYEILRDETGKGVLVAMGLVPEAFPELSRDELIATLDLDIQLSGDSFKGKTPYPYPTGTGGAVEMTSDIMVSGDTMKTADRGYAADGSVVWGAGSDATYNWSRTECPFTVVRHDGGLATIDLAHPEDDQPETGGRVYVHYTGWTADGHKFDSSRDKGQPWPLQWPVSQMRVIAGWQQGFDGVMKGTVRKLIIPSSMAYGAQGVARAGIGPSATLYFDTEVIAIQAPPPPPEEAPAPDAPEDGDQ
ncbi:MAG: FKBP-type peptidyl-prolyl cis-trans isomerase [Phycisphaeraceae bacterium]|nr:MAG: FKBP-type peptidyl-prolyl cis-trans isomerase [Phycisphaeraceae bacterium]